MSNEWHASPQPPPPPPVGVCAAANLLRWCRYIYEPWKAPSSLQRELGCVVGQDYPAPIVDHAAISETNKARIGACYLRLRGDWYPIHVSSAVYCG
jgi:hypothetical protein